MNESPNESKRAQVSNLCPELHVDESEVERLFDTLDAFGGFDPPSGELSIALLPRDEIERIHQEFMQDPTATDVITFPGDSEVGLAGEICVCPEVAWNYALAHSKDFSQELSLYLAHGYLHLCGFDDIDESDRSAIRKAEAIAMATLITHGAIPHFQFDRPL
jgi:probable rRNA maturation factor